MRKRPSEHPHKLSSDYLLRGLEQLRGDVAGLKGSSTTEAKQKRALLKKYEDDLARRNENLLGTLENRCISLMRLRKKDDPLVTDIQERMVRDTVNRLKHRGVDLTDHDLHKLLLKIPQGSELEHEIKTKRQAIANLEKVPMKGVGHDLVLRIRKQELAELEDLAKMQGK